MSGRRPFRLLLVTLAGTGVLSGVFACSQNAARPTKTDNEDAGGLSDDFSDWSDDTDQHPETPLGVSSDDAGNFSVPTRPNDGGTKDDARVADDDAAVEVDSGDCTGELVAGDLRVVEFMVSSKTGSGDSAEWIEIQSARTCNLNVRGVTVSSPRGTTGSDTVTVDHDLILPPYGTFIVADSSDSSKNGGLPGDVLSWETTDSLKNDGDSVLVTLGTTTIDALTYPSLSPTPGVSFEFPSDCAWSDRGNWQRWSRSVHTFGTLGTLLGTPNADNSDVACF